MNESCSTKGHQAAIRAVHSEKTARVIVAQNLSKT
jgi:phage terminase small subunit